MLGLFVGLVLILGALAVLALERLERIHHGRRGGEQPLAADGQARG